MQTNNGKRRVLTAPLLAPKNVNTGTGRRCETTSLLPEAGGLHTPAYGAISPTGNDDQRARVRKRWLDVGRRKYLLAVTNMSLIWVGVFVVLYVFCSAREEGDFSLAGSVFSLLSGAAVISTYCRGGSWRRHPNPIILYKSVCDFTFAMAFIMQYLLDERWNAPKEVFRCKAVAAISQTVMLSGELFVLAICVDMLISVSNPFNNFKKNLKRALIGCLATGLLSGILLLTVSKHHVGLTVGDFCWINKHETLNGVTSWTFYYAWVFAIDLYCIGALIYVARMFNKGLSEIFANRERVVMNVAVTSVIFAVYSSLLVALFLAMTFIDEERYKNSQKEQPLILVCLFAYVSASRGAPDLVVWSYINGRTAFLRPEDGSAEYSALQPQLNLALRRQLVQMTIRGIVQACQGQAKAAKLGSGPAGSKRRWWWQMPKSNREVVRLDVQIHDRQRRRSYSRMSSSTLFDVDEEQRDVQVTTKFWDYDPSMFRYIRQMFGISDEDYIQAFSYAKKETLTEGRSGAFLFFSSDEKFIVKSMSSEERKVLVSILPQYLQYVQDNPATFLPRFYGCHEMRVFNRTYSFVVMANVLATEKAIHRRYDIKGSWIARNAPVPVKGQRYTCSYCNRQFIYGKREKCVSIIGECQPNITLRDNDLRKKIRLPEDVSAYVTWQIIQDVNFLASKGLMDYSLLIGTHYSEFHVASRQQSSSLTQRHSSSASLAQSLHLPQSSSQVGAGLPSVHESLVLLESQIPRVSQLEETAKDRPAGPHSLGTSASMIDHLSGYTAPVDLKRLGQNTISAPSVSASAGVREEYTASSSSSRNHMDKDGVPTDVHRRLSVQGPSHHTSVSSSGLEENEKLHVSKKAHSEGIASESSYAERGSEEDRWVFPASPRLELEPSVAAARGLEADTVAGPGVYFIGVIDILQRWDWKKRLERFYKVYILQRDSEGISAVPPAEYCHRFCDKLENIMYHSCE